MTARRETDGARSAARRIAAECLALRVRRLSRSVTRIYDEALRPLGVGTAQLNMLVAITLSGPTRPSELARALDLEKSTVTRNLERMLARGWLRATPEERGYRVEALPAGRALLERALPAWTRAQVRASRQVGTALATAVRGLGVGGALPG